MTSSAASQPLSIGLLGADGRMGLAVSRVLSKHRAAHLSAALSAPGSDAVGQDMSVVTGRGPTGVRVTDSMDEILGSCDVLIDFSAPGAVLAAAKGIAAGARCRALVSGTTGLTSAQSDELEAYGADFPLLRSGNFSPGVTALAALVELATEKLGTGWDIEVLEMHHRHKVDAPSGTAFLLGEAAAKGRGLDLAERRVLAREGVTGERADDEIGFATLRGGGVVGRHEVRLASNLEMITLSHDAFDRSVFARGAVDAALWLADKPAGLYSMRDRLGFD